MNTFLLTLNLLKSTAHSAGRPACFMVATLLAVPLLTQADVVVLRDTVEGDVNIRIAPEGGAEVIGRLSRGEHVQHVQAHGHRWRELRLSDGRTGFISQTWTEVAPDPLENQGEETPARPTDESVVAVATEELVEAEVIADVSDDSVTPGALNEVTEREDVIDLTVMDTPEEMPDGVVERKVVEDRPLVGSTDQVLENKIVDEPIVAEGSDDVVEPEAMDVPVDLETPKEAVDPRLSDEHVVAEEAADAPVGEESPSGTPDYVVKVPASTTGGSSNIFDDGINIGIGTSEPQQRLDVNGNIQLYNRNSNIAVLTLTQATGNIGYIMHNLAGTMTIGAGSQDRITIDRDGNVGIGTNRPRHPLEMANGASVTAGGVWTNASSVEYKENITELGLEEALATIEGLSPVRFNYRVDKADEYIGFIAEDVPDLVASKDRRGLSSMDIVAVLTRVLQGQQKKIEELEARLDER